MSLSLAYRAARSSLAAHSALRVSLAAAPVRHAGLSAIHRGLVRSEKARPQGARSASIKDGTAGEKPMNYAERRQARLRRAHERPTYKIRKGKKDITEYPDEAKPQSRRARFYDPDSSFGKKSMVYQLKTGQLRDELKVMQARESGRSEDSAFERTGPRLDLKPATRRAERRMTRGGGGRRDRDTMDATDMVAELSRPAGFTRDAPRGGGREDRRGASRDSGGPFGRVAPRDSRVAPRDSSGPFGGDALRKFAPKGRDGPRTERDFTPRDRDAPRRDFAPRDSDGPRRERAFAPRDSPRRERGFTPRDRDAPRRERDFAPRDSDGPRRERDFTPRDRAFPRRERAFPRTDRNSALRKPAFSPGDRDGPRAQKNRDPISVPYTTAASQFIYGTSVVEAVLRSTRRQLYKLYIYGGANRQTSSNDDALIRSLAKRRNVPVITLDESGLPLMDKMSHSRPHNGLIIEASPLPQPPLAALGPLPTSSDPDTTTTNLPYPITLAHQSAEEASINGTPTTLPAPPTTTHQPLVVILDQILDPGNLGAILRTASFLGATAVGVTTKGSATTLSPVAWKASAGASETLALFSIPSLPEFLNASRANGWSVYAAVAGESAVGVERQRRCVTVRDVEETDPLRREPCVLLLGSEGEGLAKLTVKKADYEVRIPNLAPGGSGVDSLNVGVAAGLLCASFLRGVAKEREGTGMGGGVVGVEGKEPLW